MSFPFTAAAMIAAAPFIGCFGASAVRRRLDGKSFFFLRSCCDGCGRQLALRDLVPILSWLMRAGRCRHCSAPITYLYPAVEAAFPLIALWSAYTYADDMLLFLATLVLGWTLVILVAFDVIAFILPNVLTLPLAASGLLLATGEGLGQFQQSALGLVAGGGSLLAVSLLYKHVRGREGLGLGDVKLFAAAGAWVKLDGLPSVLLIGSLLGLLYAGVVLRRSAAKTASDKIPFGAGLCVGFWLTWIYGPVFDWPVDIVLTLETGY